MAKIRIPQSDLEAIKKLTALPGADRRKLFDGLLQSPVSVDKDDLVRSVTKASGQSRSTADSFVNLLLSMYRGSMQLAHERFVNDLCNAIQIQLGVKLDDDFEHDLQKVLSSTQIGVASKTDVLRSEFDHVYCNARILTDIRPLFGPDPTLPPIAGAVVHNLRIQFHQDKEHKSFFVALDSQDLTTLENIVKRARAKEFSLKKVMQQSSIKYLDQE